MTRYLLAAHDGFGLGHTRRNSLIADALRTIDPGAEVRLISGVAKRAWAENAQVVKIPPLVKSKDGSYRANGMSFEEALAVRGRIFTEQVKTFRPDVVLIDRHPFGIGLEFRRAVRIAKRAGAAIVLGLRDILDRPDVVQEEIAGRGWAQVPDIFDQILVYGSPMLCDHTAEYGIPLPPLYCGWVTEAAPPIPMDPSLLVISAGGGGDGEAVFRLGVEVLACRPDWRGVLAAGPYASTCHVNARARVEIHRDPPQAHRLLRQAGATLQMGGYNSTFEALAAGLRPIIVPRRAPRREQAIRASRLSALNLADVVDMGASTDEVSWLLDRPRRLHPDACRTAGILLDGARRAAETLSSLARARSAA